MSRKTIPYITAAVVANVIAVVLSIWFGWYPIAIGIGILGVFFGIQIWRIAEVHWRVILLLLGETLAIWIAFSLAYAEMSANVSDALAISFQNLFHFGFVNVPSVLSESIAFRVLAGFQGFIGYMLIVSGVASAVKNKHQNGGSQGAQLAGD